MKVYQLQVYEQTHLVDSGGGGKPPSEFDKGLTNKGSDSRCYCSGNSPADNLNKDRNPSSHGGTLHDREHTTSAYIPDRRLNRSRNRA